MSCVHSIDQFFLLVAGMIVFFMQAGFGMLEAGCVSTKNVTNILFKNVMDIVVGALAYFTLGWAFSYGVQEPANTFIGGTGFWLESLPMCRYAEFFFQWTFAATATTIVSGAMAGRTAIPAYLTYAIVTTGFIYPVVVYWTWSGAGWLTVGGFQDFAGSAIVHMTGGTVALVGAIMLGPRASRKRNPNFEPIAPHSTPLVALGGMILIFGFFAFNGGSVLAILDNGDVADTTGATGALVALAMTNTVAAATGGGLAAVLISKISTGDLSLMRLINGALAGMVAICAGADVVWPWAAFVIGLIGGASMYGWSVGLQKLKIDDAIDAVPVHLGAGFWGVLSRPMFMMDGIFYTGSEASFLVFGWNLAGAITIMVWSAGISVIMFGILKKLGKLRVSAEVEESGLDVSEHGEKAYSMSEVKTPKATSVFGV